MDRELSIREIGSVESALRVVLSPLDHGSLDAWRAATLRTVKVLLDADMAAFVLPGSEGEEVYGQDYSDSVRQVYTGRQVLTHRFSMWERMIRLGTFDRARLWHPYLDEYHQSEYYQDYVVPIGAFDMIAIAIPLAEVPSGKTVAQLMFHHERETGPRFGERGLALLRLLRPAFQAGVECYRALATQRDHLARTLDSLAEGIQLHSRCGRMVHRNSALAQMLRSDSRSDRLHNEMDRIARALTSLVSEASLRNICGSVEGVAREIRTGTARYRLRGTLISGELLGPGGVFMVCVERLTPEQPSSDALRERFRLTKKETEVALLMASGKTDAEIATALCISVHTARHHSEQVRIKLDIRTRAQVGPRILEG
jgi:DNA-binding CsgD family transcriptional regulator